MLMDLVIVIFVIFKKLQCYQFLLFVLKNKHYSYIMFAVYAQDIPKITQVILPEIKRAGEMGMLNCTVTRQGNNKVKWDGTILDKT